MAMQIVIPKRGLATEDAIIVEWNAHEGDSVEKNLVVAVLETQKVGWKMEAEGPGRLDAILTVGKRAAVSNVSGIHAESKPYRWIEDAPCFEQLNPSAREWRRKIEGEIVWKE